MYCYVVILLYCNFDEWNDCLYFLSHDDYFFLVLLNLFYFNFLNNTASYKIFISHFEFLYSVIFSLL